MNIVIFFHNKIESLVKGFKEACINNNYTIAKFIYNYEEKILNQHLLLILNICFKRGNLEIIQFLYSIDNFDKQMSIIISNTNIFDEICLNGYSDLASWIYFIFGQNISEDLVKKHFKILNLHKKNKFNNLFEKLINKCSLYQCYNVD